MLICLKPKKNNNFCENKWCCKRLIGPYKILKRGENGYAYHICLKCFGMIIKKGFDKYLPCIEETISKPSKYVGIHGSEKLVDSSTETIAIAENPRTGQIIL